MREVEIKARAEDYKAVMAEIEKRYGKGGEVHKTDHYFRVPGEKKQALRVRENNGHLEFTAKKTTNDKGGEDNLEYEVELSISELDNALLFFRALGYEDFFIKRKNGFEWMAGSVHVELLSVNELGWFLEMEALLPFDSDEAEAKKANEELHRLLHEFSLSECDIENRSYRKLIVGE